MNRFLRLSLCAVSALSTGAAALSQAVFSQDKKLLLETSISTDYAPLISVLKREGDSNAVLWSRKLEPEDDLDSAVAFLDRHQKFLSNDGKIVLLRSKFLSSDDQAVRILAQDGRNQNFTMEELLEALGVAIDANDFTSRYETGDTVLELLLDGRRPPLYALWTPLSTNWVVIDLQTLKAARAEGDMRAELNRLGLNQAREMIASTEAGGLKSFLAPLKSEAAKIIPGVQKSASDQEHGSNPDITAAFKFLASQKKPEDKKWIERLLATEFDPTEAGWQATGNEITFTKMSQERLLGEQLLDRWEGQAKSEQPVPGDLKAYHFRGPLKHLGSMGGTVRLPIPVPDKPGILWIYVVPGNVASERWEASSGLIKLPCELDNRQRGDKVERPEQVRFHFGTLTPGEYRVKAVWDRRPPQLPLTSGEVATAGPGDYEAVSSPAIKVEAGKFVGGLILDCTNRVPGAAEYYAADEAWRTAYAASKAAERTQP